MILRVIIFLLAFVYPFWTKATFYLELMVQLIEAGLPVDVDNASFFMAAKMMAGCIIFLATYYSFWFNLAFSLLALLSNYVGRLCSVGDEDFRLISSFLVLIFLQALSLILTRMLVSQVYFIIAESETARDDSD